MMEETSDDTNGESTFEFVGGKMDESLHKDDIVSSTTNVESIPPVTVPKTDPISISSHIFSPSIVESPLITLPIASTIPPLHATSDTDTSNVSLPSSIPMYDPIRHSSGASGDPFVSLRSPVAPTQAFYQPIPSASSSPSIPQIPSVTTPIQQMPPASPPIQQMSSTSPPIQQIPSAQNPYSQASLYMKTVSPIAPPQQQMYMPSPSVAIPQSALELPMDDNFVSSSGQGFQETGNERGVWGWIKGNEFLSKVAEKAKNSVDSVITTLDPGMKEIIYSGGDVSLVVASGNEPKVSAIREAFQYIFGKATVEGIAVQSMSIAPQPVGYSAGAKAAEERISNLRQQGLVHEHQVVVAIENFLAELTPEKWFDVGCILLQDPMNRINLQIYTEAIPVENQFVMQAKEQTPPDYPLGWSGFAVTIGQVIGPVLGVHHSEWHQALTGVSRREILLLAAKTIAGMYKNQLRS